MRGGVLLGLKQYMKKLSFHRTIIKSHPYIHVAEVLTLLYSEQPMALLSAIGVNTYLCYL